jgi:hypothetical protein
VITCVGTVAAYQLIPREATATTVTGTCNANGVSNVVNCKAQGPSMASVRVGEGEVFDLWFDGLPEQLPDPPAHLVGHKVNCFDDEFLKWIRATEGFYFYDAAKVVTLTAGEPDLVTLTGAAVNIFDRKEISFAQGTAVKCGWGGGGETEDFQILIDTPGQKTNLQELPPNIRDSPWSPARPMPPADVALGTKSEAVVTIKLASKPHHAYRGAVILSTSTNGASAKLAIGGEKDPLRWVQPDPGLNPYEDGYYALDDTGHWTRNWDPYS